MAAERASSRTETEKKSRLETIDLMKRFGRNPVRTRRDIRVELSWMRLLAFNVFALVVFVSDGLLEIKTPDVANPATRFLVLLKDSHGAPNDSVLPAGEISRGDHIL